MTFIFIGLDCKQTIFEFISDLLDIKDVFASDEVVISGRSVYTRVNDVGIVSEKKLLILLY